LSAEKHTTFSTPNRRERASDRVVLPEPDIPRRNIICGIVPVFVRTGRRGCKLSFSHRCILWLKIFDIFALVLNIIWGLD